MDEIIDDISDKIFLEKLKAEFMESVKGYVQKLKEYNAGGKYSEMGKIAHDIKGIVGVFGFNKGTELASDLLNSSDSGDKDKIQGIYSLLISYLEDNVLEINAEDK